MYPPERVKRFLRIVEIHLSNGGKGFHWHQFQTLNVHWELFSPCIVIHLVKCCTNVLALAAKLVLLFVSPDSKNGTSKRGYGKRTDGHSILLGKHLESRWKLFHFKRLRVCKGSSVNMWVFNRAWLNNPISLLAQSCDSMWLKQTAFPAPVFVFTVRACMLTYEWDARSRETTPGQNTQAMLVSSLFGCGWNHSAALDPQLAFSCTVQTRLLSLTSDSPSAGSRWRWHDWSFSRVGLFFYSNG